MTGPYRLPSGFRFGAAQATALTEIASSTIIRIVSDKGHTVDVRTTRTGQMRVYVNGMECASTRGRSNPAAAQPAKTLGDAASGPGASAMTPTPQPPAGGGALNRGL